MIRIKALSVMRVLFQSASPLRHHSAFVNRALCLSKRRIVMSGVRTALDEMGTKGEFKREASGFRSFIEKGGEFEPESEIRC